MSDGTPWSFVRPYLKYKVWLKSLDAPDDIVNLPLEQFQKLLKLLHSLPPNATPEQIDGVFMQFFDKVALERWRIRNRPWFSAMMERRNKDFFFESLERTKSPHLNLMFMSIKRVFVSDIEKNAATIMVQKGIYDWYMVFQHAQDEWINNLTRTMGNVLVSYRGHKIPDWHMVIWKIKLEVCDNKPGPYLLKRLLHMVRTNYSDRYIWIAGAWLAALGAPKDILFLPREREKELNDSISRFIHNLSPDVSLKKIDNVIMSFFENEGRRLGQQDLNWFKVMMRGGNKDFFFKNSGELFKLAPDNLLWWRGSVWRTVYSEAMREFQTYVQGIWRQVHKDPDHSFEYHWHGIQKHPDTLSFEFEDFFWYARYRWMDNLIDDIEVWATEEDGHRYGGPSPWSSGENLWDQWSQEDMGWAMRWKIRLEVCVDNQDADFLQEFQRRARPYGRRNVFIPSSFQSKPVCKICSKPI